MKPRNALIRIHHGQIRPVVVAGLNIRFDLGFLLCRKSLNLGSQITEAVFKVYAQLIKECAMFF